jgi:hypothetical protein
MRSRHSISQFDVLRSLCALPGGSLLPVEQVRRRASGQLLLAGGQAAERGDTRSQIRILIIAEEQKAFDERGYNEQEKKEPPLPPQYLMGFVHKDCLSFVTCSGNYSVARRSFSRAGCFEKRDAAAAGGSVPAVGCPLQGTAPFMLDGRHGGARRTYD